MVTGWPFLALAGSIILAAVDVIRGVMALLNRGAKRDDAVSEEWLAHRRVEEPPDRAA
ncbi:MAG: hypothetical protein HYZ89_06680 [Candidatus Omnitrophica bacterium]|nr:hypothetical protein [Candidatus Omnitrophota bacterium]